MPTPFFSIVPWPWNFARTPFICPVCKDLTRWFPFLLPRFFRQVRFFGKCGPPFSPIFFSKRKKKKGQTSGWACRTTRVRNFGVSQKRRGQLDFCAQQWVRYVISFKLLAFRLGSIFFARLCLMLNTGRSDLRFFARKNLQTRLGVDRAKNAAQFFFSPPLGKSVNIVEKIESPCHWSIRISLLLISETARGREKQSLAMPPPSSTGHGGHYDTNNIHYLTRYCERYSWGGYIPSVFFFLLEPACM